MVCLSGRCLWVPALIVLLALCPVVAGGQGILEAEFGKPRDASAAFAVGSGHHAVTVGIAGSNLNAARLGGTPVDPDRKVVDPTSRLVVFEMPRVLDGAFQLAGHAPAGGLLRTPEGGLGGRIEARVESISGKFLPFTLLKLRYDGSPPTPGTPLLDAKGEVAAIAYEPVGGNGGYALPVEVLQRVLDAVRQGKEIRRAWLGLTLDPAAGLPRVTRTVAESPANRAGLLTGDILIEVGGYKVADYGDAVNAFFLLRPGKTTSVRVRRGSAEMVFEMVPAIAKR